MGIELTAQMFARGKRWPLLLSLSGELLRSSSDAFTLTRSDKMLLIIKACICVFASCRLILLDLLPSLLPSPRAIETLLIELPSLGVLVDERLFSYSTARVRNYVEAMSAKISLSPI